jgi:hypothetical protein
MRRIVVTRIVTKGRADGGQKCLPPDLTEVDHVKQELCPPHMSRVTVTGTGTRQPSSCGKGPTAVGESVRVLPGIPHKGCPHGLAGKGSDHQCSVQSRRSSRRQGKPATGRRTAVQGSTGIPSRRNSRFLPLMVSRLIGLCREEVSGRTALEGKPDVSKGCAMSRTAGIATRGGRSSRQ